VQRVAVALGLVDREAAQCLETQAQRLTRRLVVLDYQIAQVPVGIAGVTPGRGIGEPGVGVPR
jgi:hypothetical protein